MFVTLNKIDIFIYNLTNYKVVTLKKIMLFNFIKQYFIYFQMAIHKDNSMVVNDLSALSGHYAYNKDFRTALPQLIAVSVKNLLLLGMSFVIFNMRNIYD